MFDVHAARQRYWWRRSFLLDWPGVQPVQASLLWCHPTRCCAPAAAVSIVAVETALHLSAYFAVPLLPQSLRRVCVHRRLQLSLLNNSRAAERSAPAAPLVRRSILIGLPGTLVGFCPVLTPKRARTGSVGVTCCVSRSVDTYAPGQSSFRLTRPDTSSLLIAPSFTVRTPPSRAPS